MFFQSLVDCCIVFYCGGFVVGVDEDCLYCQFGSQFWNVFGGCFVQYDQFVVCFVQCCVQFGYVGQQEINVVILFDIFGVECIENVGIEDEYVLYGLVL